jgi:hypothetical protein
MNCSIEEEVYELKVLETLLSMQRGKSLSPNGFIVDFFQSFYEILKQNILLVVRESQISSKMLGSLNPTFLFLIPKKNMESPLGTSDPFPIVK